MKKCIYVGGKKESEMVQKELFKLGYGWYGSGKNINEYFDTYIIINPNEKFITYGQHNPYLYEKTTIRELIKENMSKEIKIQVPKGYEIDKEKSTFENIVFKKLSNKYPFNTMRVKGRKYYINSGGEVTEHRGTADINHVSSKDRAKAFLALMQLVELRDAYNEIDGGKDWGYNNPNYVIRIIEDNINLISYHKHYSVLHFRKKETRDLFYERFLDLIITAKELL